jgi:hypothetical protein
MSRTNRRATRPHEALEVYKIAHSLGLRVHALTLKLPKHELYEDALRQYKAEYLHYLARAYASAEEMIEHLKYLLETGLAGRVEEECAALIDEYSVLCRKLFNYSSAVEQQHVSDRPRA